MLLETKKLISKPEKLMKKVTLLIVIIIINLKYAIIAGVFN